MTKLPLEGIRILDATDVWAGPYTCTLLGDLGAEVIKVDSIQRFGSRGQLNPPDTRPDGTPPVMWAYPDGVPRTPGTQPWNRVALFNGINRNKLGITLNLQDPKGKDLFKRIAAISDVVIDNYAAGVFARLGLGYKDLKEVKEDIIVISMPLFGDYGTYSHYKGLGSTADPISGHATLRGYLNEDPTGLQGTVHSDAVASSTAPFAAMAAIFYRNRTGKGQFIDFGQCEAYMGHLGEVYLDYTMNGRVQSTRGNRHDSAAPHGCYRAKDEDSWVIIAVTNDEEWERFCQALGNPTWTDDPRFATSLDRHANQDELDKLVEQWTVQHDHYEIMRLLQSVRVPVGPVLDHGEVYSDPHVNERGFFEEVTHKEAGTHLYPGMNWKFSKTPLSIRIPANCLGEHNEHVFGNLLGLSQDEIAQLETDQIIGTEYLPGSDQ